MLILKKSTTPNKVVLIVYLIGLNDIKLYAVGS